MRQHDRIEKRIFISDSFAKIFEKVEKSQSAHEAFLESSPY